MQKLELTAQDLNKVVARQGDVAIMPVEWLDQEHATVRKDPALAYGEVTGHAHRLQALTGSKVLVWERDGLAVGFEVTGTDGAVLNHEEHEAIRIPPGRYAVILQREADPFSDDEWATRRIAD